MSDFTYTGTIQYETIAISGTYAINLDGAQGGNGDWTSGIPPHVTNGQVPGGLGAAIGGDIYLTAGTEQKLLSVVRATLVFPRAAAAGPTTRIYQTLPPRTP